MSECVVRMERVPKNCDDGCWGSLSGECPWCGSIDGYKMVGNRPSNCPIITVLPEGHGRLVDMRDIELMMEDAQSTSDESGMYSLVYRDDLDFEKLHTIVPSDTAESPSPKPTDPAPIRDVYYVMTECDAKTGTVKYEPRERIEP